MKKLSLKIATLFAVVMAMAPSLQAQTTVPFTFSGTSPVALQMDQYGLLSATGTYGTGTLSLSGAGTRMFWYPGKAAFRAGYVSGTDWDDSNIGQDSVALGQDDLVNGYTSVAIGSWNTAGGQGTVALGNNNEALGLFSFAAGTWAYAMGSTSVALGQNTWAGGNFSFAANRGTGTSGANSAAFGYFTIAIPMDDFVIGSYNIQNNSYAEGYWVATDPIFEIGNGQSSTTRSDALVVYKNGNMAVQGVITAAPGGDIPMYTGN